MSTRTPDTFQTPLPTPLAPTIGARQHAHLVAGALVLSLVVLGGCEGGPGVGGEPPASWGDGDTGAPVDAARPDGAPSAHPDAAAPAPHVPSYEDAFERGFARYAGTPQMEVTDVTRFGLGAAAIDVHHFSPEDRGPSCMYGDEFFVETREGSSDTLMIFLQGGGVCLDEICAATPSPILSLRLFSVAGVLGIGGLLDRRNSENPVRDFDVVNAPYCDGSLFLGDVDRVLSDGNPDNGTEDMAFQRGLQNLTATLEVAHERFPNPPRIVLVGSSGGAYGVLAGTVMTRYFYPDTPLLVLSDSGAPIVNGVDTDFIQRAVDQLNAADILPRSCEDCLANGHTTGLLEWALGFDRNLTVAYMTHARDHVIGEFFMGTTAAQFEAAVVGETDRLMQRFPGRVFRFVIPGSRHTLAMGMDHLSEDLVGTLLGAVGGLGFGFVGEDVNSEELSTWALGGMNETGLDPSGRAWSAYAWVRTLLSDPVNTPDVLQLE
ncbi:MAG: pectin acetylesterase-family hydrolase [Polyangiales bacterium]